MRYARKAYQEFAILYGTQGWFSAGQPLLAIFKVGVSFFNPAIYKSLSHHILHCFHERYQRQVKNLRHHLLMACISEISKKCGAWYCFANCSILVVVIQTVTKHCTSHFASWKLGNNEAFRANVQLVHILYQKTSFIFNSTICHALVMNPSKSHSPGIYQE